MGVCCFFLSLSSSEAAILIDFGFTDDFKLAAILPAILCRSHRGLIQEAKPGVDVVVH